MSLRSSLRAFCSLVALAALLFAAAAPPAAAVNLPTGFTTERVGYGPFGTGRPVGRRSLRR